LGRAVEINPSTNPRIIGADLIRVIKVVTGVDLGKTQEGDAMRKAIEVLKTKFDESFIATQLDEIKSLRQQRTELQAVKAPDVRAIKKLTGQIKKQEKLAGAVRRFRGGPSCNPRHQARPQSVRAPVLPRRPGRG
jgi:hypothetical protein